MRLPIDYDRPGRFPTVSAAVVLRGEASALFEGKIVLIGGTAAGVGSTFVTPFSSLMAGVERHATVVDSILRGDFLLRRCCDRIAAAREAGDRPGSAARSRPSPV